MDHTSNKGFPVKTIWLWNSLPEETSMAIQHPTPLRAHCKALLLLKTILLWARSLHRYPLLQQRSAGSPSFQYIQDYIQLKLKTKHFNKPKWYHTSPLPQFLSPKTEKMRYFAGGCRVYTTNALDCCGLLDFSCPRHTSTTGIIHNWGSPVVLMYKPGSCRTEETAQGLLPPRVH